MKHFMPVASLASVLFLCVPGPCAGQGVTTDTASARVAAERAARAWLALVDSGRYDEGWKQAATTFRATVTQSQFELSVRRARAPFEPFGERSLLGAHYYTQVPNAPPGEYVALQFATLVAGGRQVIEAVTPMKDADGAWRVSGYYLRPE